MKNKFLGIAGALVCAHLIATPAGAQTFPNKPVRIVVPVASGGTTDVLARQIGAKLQTAWNEGVVVENKPGVVGNLGTEIVVRSPADGYTLVLQSNAMAINQALGVKANFTPEKDLTPIVMMGQTPMIILANPALNIKSMSELVAYAKSKPGSLSYASCGIGGPHHMFMELVKQKAGIDITHVSYKGCAPGLTDVLGNQIPLAVVSANSAIQYIKSKKLIGIGVSSAARYTPLAEVPTVEEQGYKGIDFSNWYALYGPANMPKSVVNKIYTDVVAALKDDAVKSNLSGAGIELYIANGDEVARVYKADSTRYEQIAKTANIKLE